MAWTYSGNPSASNLDAVRFLVGDTDTTDQQLSDAEVTYLITQWPNPLIAAANACARIAAKYSRQADKSVGQLSVSASQRAKAYADRAAELKATRNGRNLSLFVGGRSQSAKDAFGQNADAVQPAFAVGQNDYPPNDPSTPPWGRNF